MTTLGELAAIGILVCPACLGRLEFRDQAWFCTDSGCRCADSQFPTIANVPALVDFKRSVLDASRLRATDGASSVPRSRGHQVLRRLIHPTNQVAPRLITRMVNLLRADGRSDDPPRKPRVLLIGGGTIGNGLHELYHDRDVDLVCFDIYASPVIDFVGDAHALPLASGSMDGAIVQAVLEHVLEPTVVAAEIERVVRLDGMLYADTPFLQQVHEGAYDFTRFTDSGHRNLFRGFEPVASGVVAGAGTSLRWSIDHFVRALTRSVLMGRVVALAFFWLSHLDRVLDPRHSNDSASSVFFLGRRSEHRATPAEIIDYYQGGM